MNINGTEYDLVIERKRIKNIYLRVKDNTLFITCPYYVTNKEINEFIYFKKDWIEKVYFRKITNSKLVVGETIFYKGKEYLFKVYKGNKSLKFEENSLIIHCKSGDINDAINVLYELSKKTLMEDIYSIQDKYLDILTDYGYRKKPEYHIKKLKSMWGVCYSKKNIVNISSRLIHFDDMCLEAILWHELLHFVIPNHSKRFYDVLEYHLPGYKEIVNTIK